MGEGLRATCWIWGIVMDETGQASVMVWLKFCAGHRVIGIDFDGADRNIGYADAERDCRDVDGRDDQGSEVEGFVDVDRDVGKYVDGLDSDGADTTVYVQAEGNDRKNVRSRGEAEQALVVAPPQDAVAVVTGDEGTGVDVAGVGHPGVGVTGVQPTRVDTARVETARIGTGGAGAPAAASPPRGLAAATAGTAGTAAY